MKIVIPGGSGQIGTMLARSFSASGDDVCVIGRSTPRVPVPWRIATWDGRSVGEWTREIDGADVVINLAGRTVNCRYHAANRKQIIDSRVDSTRIVGEAIAAAATPPRVWLQSSTATIYAHRYDAPNDEATGIIGGPGEPGVPETWRFSVSVAKAWEQALADAPDLAGCRKVAMRTSIVMNPDRGSAFCVLLGLVRRGLGGRNGNGRQFVSWIHDADFVRAVRWLIAHDELAGAVNIASPNPLPNADFMRELRRAAGVWFGLPAARWMLEIGAFFLRTETELILKSRRVVPGRLVESGFTFEHPLWPAAVDELVARWRAMRSAWPRETNRAPDA
ncbi:MAG: epimerase [Planctomycetota bacterium]